MIGQLLAIVGEDKRPAFHRFLSLTVAFCLLQGLGFLLILPTMNAVFEGDTSALWTWLMPLIGVALGAMVLNYRASVQGVELTFAIGERLYRRIGDHITALPLGWFGPERAGQVSRTIIGSSQQVTLVLGFLMLPFVSGFLTPAVLTAGLLIVDWRIGVAFVAAIPFLYGADRLGRLFRRRGDGGVDRAAARADARVIEYAQAQSVLRANGAVGDANRALGAALLAQRRASARQLVTTVPGSVIFRVAVQLVLLLVIVAIVPRALGGELPAGTAVALIAVAAQFTASVGTLSDLAGAIRLARSSLRRINDILTARPLPVPEVSAVPSGPAELRFENVRFDYGTGPEVLGGVSFTVPAGTTTAVVGPSGAGKSTLIKLAARFHDVTGGAVTLAGHDVRDLTLPALMDQVSLVLQDVYLFDDTIWENIRVGREGASDAEVREAARIARVEEIAGRLPDGWHTRVGEGGHSLSGGERQRVSIARALLKNAPVILLDEATSAMDPLNEAAFLRGLAGVTERRTVLVVAHRLSTIRSADRILFLADGHVAESGTHEELLAADGPYAAFWRQRTKATSWSLARTPLPAPGLRP
ncbi:ABC transporter ATP-binding protein [Streptomyces sp. NPDC093252]|uniref:ABC transporter ATP-binding protein n=1 Tax=Streptomyces sp. NPDC093252 TaxID=3154980 RepID=UPI0034405FF8